jgi:hypothetical protein
MKLRFALIFLFGLSFISGCSTVNKTFDSIGGLFNKKGDQCSGPECENPSLIDNGIVMGSRASKSGNAKQRLMIQKYPRYSPKPVLLDKQFYRR